VAASSAVPIFLSPVTLKNYAGTCNFGNDPVVKSVLEKQESSERRSNLIQSSIQYQDSENIRYIHLVDGGISDNLGVRAVLDSIIIRGSFWAGLKDLKHSNVRNVVFIVVNAERALSSRSSFFERSPSFGVIMNSYASTVISRYNFETLTLLKESFEGWRQDVQKNRCPDDDISLEPGSCGDVSFHLIEVKFSALEDEKEQEYFMQIPTSFKLNEEQVDKLKNIGRRILRENNEYQILIDSAIVKD
jgi:NTE family protein